MLELLVSPLFSPHSKSFQDLRSMSMLVCLSENSVSQAIKEQKQMPSILIRKLGSSLV